MLEFAEPMANHVANVILGAIWLTLFGTLFAPIAGIVCSLIARAKRHQRPGGSYWTTGAWYSMLFFAPWLYLVIRMLGLRVPNILVRIWYGIFFACWLIGVLSLFAGSVQQIIVEGRAADGVLLALAAVFLLAVEFVAIRRLMRRQVAYTEERSPVMRRTYALLQALWLAGSVCFVFVGLRELQEYDKLDSAIPLWVLAGFLVAAWLAVRSSIKSSYVDSLDFPGRTQPDAIPPDRAYIEPFALMWRMLAIVLAVTIAVWVFNLILWIG